MHAQPGSTALLHAARLMCAMRAIDCTAGALYMHTRACIIYLMGSRCAARRTAASAAAVVVVLHVGMLHRLHVYRVEGCIGCPVCLMRNALRRSEFARTSYMTIGGRYGCVCARREYPAGKSLRD